MNTFIIYIFNFIVYFKKIRMYRKINNYIIKNE